MFRWIPFLLALACALLSLLNAVKCPAWVPWRLAVLTGEYGHALVLLPLAVAIGAWCSRAGAPRLTMAAIALSVVAIGLLLRPAFDAARLARGLPAQLESQFGRVVIARAPFALSDFFGAAPEPVASQTMPFSGGLALDFYRAVRADERLAPCVIVIHGGGWDSGDRGQIAHFNHWLARQGYAVAAISYRLAPQFQWPAQRDDTLAALAFLKARSGELGLDPTRFVLLGRSAGGQIAQAAGYKAHDPAIRGVVGLYAPSDLIFGYVNTHENDMLKSPALMRQYLGGTPDSARANYESASAIYHVNKSTPPTLLVHGTNDALVWYRHSVRLDARLAEAGVPRAYVALPWATHAFEFNLHGPGGQLTTYALEWFLASVFSAK